MVGARGRQVEELAGSLRARLIEQRRAAAAAGATLDRGLDGEIHDLVATEAGLLGVADREAVAALILRDTVGLGPLEDLLAAPAAGEGRVNGPGSAHGQ